MNPNAMRLGINKTWKSLWYSQGEEYKKQLHEDLMIRKYLNSSLKLAGLDRIKISRSLKKVEVTVFVARPGVAIGRGGEAIDEINKDLGKKMKMSIDVRIKEVSAPDISADIIAGSLANAMERGQSPTRAMLAEKEKVMHAGAKGVKIWVAGDFGVPKQSRTIKLTEGHVPLQTLRSNIDFARERVLIRNEGIRGIKVWIYKGDILDLNNLEDNESEDK